MKRMCAVVCLCAVAAMLSLYVLADAGENILAEEAIDEVCSSQEEKLLPEPEVPEEKTVHSEQWYNDLRLLSACVYSEAGIEDEYGQRLVCDVILNRVASPDFPNSIAGVVYQKNQFSVVANGDIERKYPYMPDRIVEICKEELIDQVNYDVLFFRTGNYHTFGTPLFKWGHHYFSGR